MNAAPISRLGYCRMSDCVRAIVIATTVLGLAGCSVGPFGRESSPSSAARPEALRAAPTGQVTSTPLPPPGGPLSGTDVAALPPGGAGNLQIGRPDLLGGWTISSAGDTCQLFMSLTTWTGGYRATTRNCATPALTGISAWNVEGNQVQLFNDSGATVARLTASSKTQFFGQTSGGGPISFSR